MRRVLIVVCLLAACGASSAPPTPEEILADDIVTEAEFLAALGAVEGCVEATGAEFSVDFDQHNTPQYHVRGGGAPGALETVFTSCLATHLGRVELAWADQNGQTPEEDAAFYDGVVSCVELALGVEFGTVQPRGAGGPDTAVTDAAIAADPDLYDECFDRQLARGRR